MNFKSRKVAVTVLSATTGFVILSAVMLNGATAGTTVKNSGMNQKTGRFLEININEEHETADVSARTECLVGAEDSEAQNVTETAEAQQPAEEPVQVSAYENKFMVNVDEYLNIRSEADENASIVGKLYAGAGGDIIAKGDQWTQISSGNVTGYVNNDYILTGADAEAKANEVGTLTATITGESIRVRETADPNGKIYGLAAQDETYTCTAQLDGWLEITYDDGPAYIASEYASVELKVGKAISIEEEQAQLAAKAREEQKTVQEKQFEETVSESQSTETVQTDAYNLSYDDAYLLACLVYTEAGSEPYEGKLATANVVLNRLNSGAYGSTISDVIYARGQFSVVGLGIFAAALSSGPNSDSVAAANEALSGVNNVPNYTGFCATSVAKYGAYNSYTVIGNQVYYN